MVSSQQEYKRFYRSDIWGGKEEEEEEEAPGEQEIRKAHSISGEKKIIN